MISLSKDKKSKTPLYLQIKQIIKEKILNSMYPYGTLIPSELYFQKEYNLSRITIRQGILELEREGYVKRTRGQGTRVVYQKQIEEDLTRIMSFSNEMRLRGFTPGTKNVSVNMVKISPELKVIFKKDNCELLELKRVRMANDEVIGYFKSYFQGDINLPRESEYYQNSLYDLMDQYNILKPSKSFEKVSAIIADKELARTLEIAVKSPILVRERISFDANNEVLEYTTVYYPAKKYSYIIET